VRVQHISILQRVTSQHLYSTAG